MSYSKTKPTINATTETPIEIINFRFTNYFDLIWT